MGKNKHSKKPNLDDNRSVHLGNEKSQRGQKKKLAKKLRPISSTSEVIIQNIVHGSWPPLRKDTIDFFEALISECLRPDFEEIKSKKKRIECQNHFNELKERLMIEIKEVSGPTKKMATYQNVKKETGVLEADLEQNTVQIQLLATEIQKYDNLVVDIEKQIEKLED